MWRAGRGGMAGGRVAKAGCGVGGAGGLVAPRAWAMPEAGRAMALPSDRPWRGRSRRTTTPEMAATDQAMVSETVSAKSRIAFGFVSYTRPQSTVRFGPWG